MSVFCLVGLRRATLSYLYKIINCLSFRVSRHKDLFKETGFFPRKGKLTKVYKAPVSRTVAHFKSALPYLTRILNSV